MTLNDIVGIEKINEASLKQPVDLYIGDLLSCVMANIEEGSLWLTTQTNLNVVAIAHLHELAGIIFVENMKPNIEVINKANECGIALYTYPDSSYHLALEITQMGLNHVL